MNRKQLNPRNLLLIAATVIWGCDGGGTAGFVQTVEVDPGEECKNGGVMIVSGLDENDDGELTGDEISSTETVCNGDQADALVNISREYAGENCAGGGHKIETGLDNGDGEGTAGNGELEAGEVDSVKYSCDNNQLIRTGSFTQPDGPAGQYTIDLTGGEGDTGGGGDGGYMDIEISYGSSGGHIKFFSTGQTDASFEMPDVTDAFLGDEPLHVTEDTEVVRAADLATGEALADGTVFLILDNGNDLRLSNGNVGESVIITGIKVDAGVTLTFTPNVNGNTMARFQLQNSFVNNGRLTTKLITATKDRASLDIDACDTFIGNEGSEIVLRGADDPTQGGNGGDLEIDADDNDYSVEQDIGSIINRGTVDTSGGEGDDGGDAGYIDWYANNRIWNSGNCTAKGGRGTDSAGGDGGDGDYIEFDTDYGSNFNSATLDASGGSGAVTGGDAGYVYLYIGYNGDVKNTGILRSNGGDADEDCTAGCAGGDGDYIEFYIYGGGIYNDAQLVSRGGRGAAGTGGDGGYLYLEYGYDSGWYGEYIPAKNFELSGNINLSGGDGEMGGGDAGYIEAYLDADYVPAGQEIIFYGYTGFDLSGGSGTSGGDSGYVYAYHYYGESDNLSYTPSGGVINYVPMTLNGGEGTDGNGGDSDYVWFETDEYYAYITDSERVYNHADLRMNGGDGTNGNGGDAGYVFMFGNNRVENHGNLIMNGGDALSGNFNGGQMGDDTQLISDNGLTLNTGNITMRGGNASGTGTGGDTDYGLEIVGATCRNTGDLKVNGGNGDDAAGFGGDSEFIFLYGMYNGTTNSGSLQANGGSADTDGADGNIFIDGINVTDTL